jgi:uncharacterized protein YkwD
VVLARFVALLGVVGMVAGSTACLTDADYAPPIHFTARRPRVPSTAQSSGPKLGPAGALPPASTRMIPANAGAPAAASDAGAPNAAGGAAPQIPVTPGGMPGTPPAAGTPGSPASPGADAFAQKNLDVINQFRAREGAPPLALDTALSTFAAAGSSELSQDHAPHQHFESANDAPFRGSAGENQGDPNGWPRASDDDMQNELQQIEQILQAMYDEGPGGGHHDNIVSRDYTRLGVGLLAVDGQLYLTNDFTQ